MYIVGTKHDESLKNFSTRQNEFIEKIAKESKVFVVESSSGIELSEVLSKLHELDSFYKDKSEKQTPETHQLQNLISAGLVKKFNLGSDQKNLIESQVRQLKPWATLMLAGYFLNQKSHPDGMDEGIYNFFIKGRQPGDDTQSAYQTLEKTTHIMEAFSLNSKI